MVDIYKLILSHVELLTAPERVVVFADFDLDALNHKQIYGKRTQDKLNRFGFVFSATGINGYENSFHIMKLQSSEGRDAFLDSLNIFLAEMILFAPSTPSPQQVYNQMPSDFFALYYLKRGWIKVSDKANKLCKLVQQSKHNEEESAAILNEIQEWVSKMKGVQTEHIPSIIFGNFGQNILRVDDYVLSDTIEGVFSEIVSDHAWMMRESDYLVNIRGGYYLFNPKQNKWSPSFQLEDLCDWESDPPIITEKTRVRFRTNGDLIDDWFIPGKFIRHAANTSAGYDVPFSFSFPYTTFTFGNSLHFVV